MPSYSLGELARAIEAELDGDPTVQLTGVAPLETAGPGDLSFLANPKYVEAAHDSDAGALIVDAGYEANGQNVLRSPNPYLSFARAIDLLLPEPPWPVGTAETAVIAPDAVVSDDVAIGPHAVVGAGVEIGRGARIDAGCVLEPGVRIGEGTWLMTRVTVHGGTRVGARCIVQSGSVLGAHAPLSRAPISAARRAPGTRDPGRPPDVRQTA